MLSRSDFASIFSAGESISFAWVSVLSVAESDASVSATDSSVSATDSLVSETLSCDSGAFTLVYGTDSYESETEAQESVIETNESEAKTNESETEAHESEIKTSKRSIRREFRLGNPRCCVGWCGSRLRGDVLEEGFFYFLVGVREAVDGLGGGNFVDLFDGEVAGLEEEGEDVDALDIEGIEEELVGFVVFDALDVDVVLADEVDEECWGGGGEPEIAEFAAVDEVEHVVVGVAQEGGELVWWAVMSSRLFRPEKMETLENLETGPFDGFVEGAQDVAVLFGDAGVLDVVDDGFVVFVHQDDHFLPLGEFANQLFEAFVVTALFQLNAVSGGGGRGNSIVPHRPTIGRCLWFYRHRGNLRRSISETSESRWVVFSCCYYIQLIRDLQWIYHSSRLANDHRSEGLTDVHCLSLSIFSILASCCFILFQTVFYDGCLFVFIGFAAPEVIAVAAGQRVDIHLAGESYGADKRAVGAEYIDLAAVVFIVRLLEGEDQDVAV